MWTPYPEQQIQAKLLKKRFKMPFYKNNNRYLYLYLFQNQCILILIAIIYAITKIGLCKKGHNIKKNSLRGAKVLFLWVLKAIQNDFLEIGLAAWGF